MVLPMAMCGQEELDISRDGSQYSLTTGILPSLGARSNRRVQLRPLIISPYDRRYRFPLHPSTFSLLVFLTNTLDTYIHRFCFYHHHRLMKTSITFPLFRIFFSPFSFLLRFREREKFAFVALFLTEATSLVLLLRFFSFWLDAILLLINSCFVIFSCILLFVSISSSMNAHIGSINNNCFFGLKFFWMYLPLNYFWAKLLYLSVSMSFTVLLLFRNKKPITTTTITKAEISFPFISLFFLKVLFLWDLSNPSI